MAGTDSAERRAGRDALVLDMDGVIVDSEPIHKKADAAVFRSIGLDVPVAVLQGYAGVGGDVFFRSVLERYGREGDPAALRAEKNRALAAFLREEAPPVPGIRGLLDRAERGGLRLAVASSSDGSIVELVLGLLGIRDRFETVVDGSRVARGKPAPDLFLEAARRLSLPPARCVVVEDSAAGTRAAKAAGMPCVGLRNPNSGAQDLSAADRIVDSLDAIGIGLLDGLLRAASGPLPGA
jgi:HAD superfamily hydrolase (TIGR01509 family)